MNNKKIRIKMLELDMKQWELARLLGIGESSVSRKLRDELPEEEQDRICTLIDETKSSKKKTDKEASKH